MKINVSVYARATGEKRQAYMFETEYDITWKMNSKQQKLFYLFIQWFIAWAFKRFTNEYRGLLVWDAKEDRPSLGFPTYSTKIENFEAKIGDYPFW